MKLYLRILSYGNLYLKQGIIGFVSLFFFNFFSVFSIALVIPFLQILFAEDNSNSILQQAQQSLDPGLMDQVYLFMYGFVDEHGKWDALLLLCVGLGTSIFLKSAFKYASSYFIAPYEQGVIFQLRTKLFDHLKRMGLSFFTGQRKGDTINILVSDVQIVQESVIGTVQTVLSSPISIVLILVSLFVISWQLTLFTLIVLPLTGLFVNYISKTLKKRAKRGQEKLGGLISILDEFMTGIRIVKAFGAERFEQEKYQGMNDQYRQEMIGLKRRNDLASPVTEVLSIGVIITIILYGGNLILSGSQALQPESFIGFIALFGSFIQPIKALSAALSRIQKGIASFQRIESFLQREERIQEAPAPRRIREFAEGIVYEDVSFKYDSEDVLKGIQLRIGKGETVALVGPSGGGKSTLVDLLPRFYDPYQGRILVDGQDLRSLRLPDLRSLISVVTQEGILFNDTVLGNIAFGEPEPDLARAKSAARAAHAHDFITALEKGYETNIGERGAKLSGGQRQRLSIARAIYKNAPILVLDEATSALDSASEKLVQAAIDHLTEDRTSIVIAHRLSTILKADRIYVIHEGKIIEEGKHEDLIILGGLYKKLFDLQFEPSK